MARRFTAQGNQLILDEYRVAAEMRPWTMDLGVSNDEGGDTREYEWEIDVPTIRMWHPIIHRMVVITFMPTGRILADTRQPTYKMAIADLRKQIEQ